MKTWQVLFLVIASGFLGILLYTVSPQGLTSVKEEGAVSPIHEFVENVAGKDVTILMTGDVMLGRSVMSKSLKAQNPNYPFEKVYERLKKADILLVNLENPIVENCPFVDSGFKFCADPKMIEGLTYSGVDVANIANNHTKNYGSDGFNQTKKYLTDAGISYVGDNNLVVKEVDGVTFGFVGFDFVTNQPTSSDFDLVKNSNSQVDILIVSVHWGVEYKDTPNETQKKIAKDLIASGADVISGTHPHWVQTFEHVNDKPVYYSLGNFIFDQMWSEPTRRGLVAELTYKKGELVNEKQMHIFMENFAQPHFLEN